MLIPWFARAVSVLARAVNDSGAATQSETLKAAIAGVVCAFDPRATIRGMKIELRVHGRVTVPGGDPVSGSLPGDHVITIELGEGEADRIAHG